MDSRSVIVSENVRALLHPDHWKGLDGPDQECLLHTMAETHLEEHVLTVAMARPAAVDIRVYRPYKPLGVLLAADGAMEVTPAGDTLGWGALVADTAGVRATVASGVQTLAGGPWAAERTGKLEAWRLTETLGVAPAAVEYVGADRTCATLGGDGGITSKSPSVDRVRATLAEALWRGRRGLYVPAQHNTQWSGLLSDLQACPYYPYER